jgi:hypothetical protein
MFCEYTATKLRNRPTVISYESSRKSLTVAGEFASLLRLYLPPQTTLDAQQFAFRFGPHVAASPLHDGPETPTSPVTHPAPASRVLASLVSATLRSPSVTLASYRSPFPSGARPHAAALTAHNIVANRQRITTSLTIARRRTRAPPKGQAQGRTPTAHRTDQSKSPVQACVAARSALGALAQGNVLLGMHGRMGLPIHEVSRSWFGVHLTNAHPNSEARGPIRPRLRIRRKETAPSAACDTLESRARLVGTISSRRDRRGLFALRPSLVDVLRTLPPNIVTKEQTAMGTEPMGLEPLIARAAECFVHAGAVAISVRGCWDQVRSTDGARSKI